MKKSILVLAALAVCLVACKNNRPKDLSVEQVNQQKVALADSVLSKIDAIFEQYQEASAQCFTESIFNLTDEEKLVVPDYLLDPSVANTLVTKSQKISALAMLIVDRAEMAAYDMPLAKTDQAIAKLAADVNFPIDNEDTPEAMSEKVKQLYNAFKERGDLAFFWQFEYAMITEMAYILSQNPELCFEKITPNEWKGFGDKCKGVISAVKELAVFDGELAFVYERFLENKLLKTAEDFESCSTVEGAKKYYLAHQAECAATRNAMIQ